MQVFFDFDGPILDCSVKYHNLYSELMKDEGLDVLSLEEYWEKKRDRWSEQSIVELTAPHGFFESYQKKRISLIEDVSRVGDDIMWPHVPTMLKHISQNHQLFLVTLRNRRETLMKQLESLGIKEHFLQVLNKDNNEGTYRTKVELIKPHLSQPSLIIGDTEVDVKAGQQLGMKTLAVSCGIRNEKHLSELQPDAILSSSSQIFDHID